MRELPSPLASNGKYPILCLHGGSVELEEVTEAWMKGKDAPLVLPAFEPSQGNGVVLEVNVLLSEADGFSDTDTTHPKELEEYLMLMVVAKVDAVVDVIPIPILRQVAL